MDPLSEWKEPIDVIIVQTDTILGSPEANIERARALISRALEEGPADLAVLPEAFATGFPYDGLEGLRPWHDKVLKAMGDLAKESSVDLIYTQLVEGSGVLRNRCFHIDRHGSTVGTYDKTHLFTRSGEDRHIYAGSSLELFRLGGALIGPLICYELRFPELSRTLTGAGASVLVYPAEWPAHRIFQWEHLLCARAVENQCFVIGVNTCGQHSRVRMGGRSMVVSPYGDRLCELKVEEGWSRCTMDPGRMEEVRSKIPAYKGLRTDLARPQIIRP